MAKWVASWGIRITTATTRNTEAGLIKTAQQKARVCGQGKVSTVL